MIAHVYPGVSRETSNSEGHSFGAWWTCFTASTVFFLSLIAITVFNGPSVINAPTDVFILLDGAGRLQDGQIPHNDFSNPIGVLTYALISIGMSIGGVDASGLSWGTALFLMVVGVWATWIGYSRLTSWLALALVIFLSLLCVATRPLGFAPDIHSYAMVYNRIGWVLIGMVFVQAFILPQKQSPRTVILDGLSLGFLVGLLFFTKITFSIVAAGAVVLAFALTPSTRRAIGVLGGLGISIGCIWWLTGVSVDGYLDDLARAAAAQSPAVRLKNIIHAIRDGALPLVTLSILWVATIGLPMFKERPPSYEALLASIQFATICAAAILLSAGNALEGAQVPAYGIAALILVNCAQREQGRITVLIGNCSAAVLLTLIAIISFPDIWSIADTTMWRSYRLSGSPIEQQFNAARLRNFVIPESTEYKTQFWRARVMPARINDGLALLRRHINSKSRIFVVATADPFSFALNLSAPRGGLLWWDRNFSYSYDAHPPAEQVFSDVNLIMVPAPTPEDDGCCKEVLEDLPVIYKEYLGANFVELERSEAWVLLGRK